MNTIRNEPVVAAGVAVVASLIGLLVAFGVDITQKQEGAILGFVGTTSVLVGLARAAVTPNRKVGTHV